MKSNERLVKFFDLTLSAYSTKRGGDPIPLPALPLEALLRKLKEYLDSTPYTRRNRQDTESWHITDISFNNSNTAVCILVGRSDRLAADQAISDPASQHFGVVEKSGKQGNASSAHVLVKLAPTSNSTYLTIIEESTGITSADIAMLMRLATRGCSKKYPEFFICNDASGDPTQRHASAYKYEFRGHPSKDFEDEINLGKLQGLELVEVSVGPVEFDGIASTREKKKVTHLTIENASRPLFEVIRDISSSAFRDGVPSLRVIFKDTGNFVRTVELETATMALINEERYVKKVRISDFGTKLATASQAVNKEIANKMFALL